MRKEVGKRESKKDNLEKSTLVGRDQMSTLELYK